MEIRFPLILDGATGTELQKRGYGGRQASHQATLTTLLSSLTALLKMYSRSLTASA